MHVQQEVCVNVNEDHPVRYKKIQFQPITSLLIIHHSETDEAITVTVMHDDTSSTNEEMA